MTDPTTHTLELPEATLTYDLRGAGSPTGGEPPLLMIGAPMEASGFTALAERFADRIVVSYDPRGVGRSPRHASRRGAHAGGP